MITTSRPSGLKSGAYSLLGLIAPLVVYLLATPFLIQKLGSAQYGVLTLLLTITTLLAGLDFGLGAGGVRGLGQVIIAEERVVAAQFLREMLTLFLVAGMLFAAIVIVGAPWIADALNMSSDSGTDEATWLLRITAISLPFTFFGAGLSLLPRALERFPGIMLIQISSNVALWGGAVLLLAFDYSLIHVTIWIAILAVGVTLIYARWNSKLLPEMNWSPATRFPTVRRIFSYSAYAFTAQSTSLITYHADKLLIAYFLGPTSVAFYAVAVNIASKILSIAAALNAFVFPRAVRLAAIEDRDKLKGFYQRASRFTLLALAPAIVPIVALAPEFLELWLGAEFSAQTAFLLQTLTIAYFIVVLSVPASQVYNGLGNSRIGAIYSTIGSFFNLGLCAILIPIYGVTGAAVAVLISVLQTIVYARSLERHLKLHWFETTGPLFGAALFVAVIQGAALVFAKDWISGWASLAAIACGAWALFYVLWAMFGFYNRDDAELMARLLPR